jgi:hypothetical protein
MGVMEDEGRQKKTYIESPDDTPRGDNVLRVETTVFVQESYLTKAADLILKSFQAKSNQFLYMN